MRAAHVGGHAGRVVDVEDRVALAAEGDAGVLAGQVAARPQARGDRLLLLAVGRLGHQHDEGGQVFIQRAQAVGPRSPGTACR